MIDDRTEEGMTEEDAVNEMGSIDGIVEQIISDIPLSRFVKEKMKPKRRLSAWETALLVLGAPVWLPLLIAVFAVLLSLYIVLWSVIISLWAAFVSLALSALGVAAAGAAFAFGTGRLAGIAMLGAGAVCAGLSVFLFFGCKAASKGTVFLTKKLTLGIKRSFIGKGRTA